MLYGLGNDIQSISQIRAVVERQPSFVSKILTVKEQNQFEKLNGKRAWEFLAGRFSAKEAYSKAFGTGIGSQLTWHDMEVLNNEQGKPTFTQQPFNGIALVSISHSVDMVATVVTLENK
ncbi:holo-ACP synthase [Periweissella cryptocerci]|uniref:Holo-[acyl-carrier-protein] synthase n=1 Tax=Periweissella cryptocerci TaxID=2506420 RepID=A0A4P6YUN5_9LACO|nr:holo-ACP synthase [Periweissella cryptocerci]QBO36498.1 holo-ACP synthase [Periweissella cryptocerci]